MTKTIVTKLKKAIPQEIKNIKHKTLSHLSNIYYGDPSSNMSIIGITGTDGKTTTTHILYDVLKSCSINSGMISTIKAKIGSDEFETGLHTTTPDPHVVPKYLKDMQKSGSDTAIIETTSHALFQGRVDAIKYSAAIYTNITKEHLDQHGTYENLVEHKSRLMKKVSADGVIIINKDDISYQPLLNHYNQLKSKPILLTYGNGNKADLQIIEIKNNESGTLFKIKFKNQFYTFQTNLKGDYNVYNCCCAILYALHKELPVPLIQEGIKTDKHLEGRWENIYNKNFQVIVDFAHTPNSLEKILNYANETSLGRVVVVFGCASQRDVYKREIMGEIAGRYADIIYLTSEDPRNEDPLKIAKEVEVGILKAGKKINHNYFIVLDREQAIKESIESAQKNDLIIITGKGHEKSMNIKGIETPWSDKDVALKYLENKQ